MSTFGEVTAVEPAGEPGRYRGCLDEHWCAMPHPFGGIVTAVALRAMQAELGDPAQKLRSVTTVYAAPVREGEVRVDVTVLRRGRSGSQLLATVHNPGDPAGATTVAVFGGSRPGFEFTDLAFPEGVKPPEQCPSFRDPPPPGEQGFRPFTFWQRSVEGRPAVGHAPWDVWEPTTSERVNWYRYEQPPRLPTGELDPLAVVTLADSMPGAVAERVGRQEKVWFAPSADLTVHVLGEARGEWLLAHNRARHAGDGWASAEMALWDAESRRLVAYGTQMMLFTFFDELPANS